MKILDAVLSTKSVIPGFSPSIDYIRRMQQFPFGTDSNLSLTKEKQLEAGERLLTEAGLQGNKERAVSSLVLLHGRKNSQIDSRSHRGSTQTWNKAVAKMA